MAIVITDDDARRLLSMEECIEAMRTAFCDAADGKAVVLPRVRYESDLPNSDLRYFANIHVGAVPSYGMACVRAGSHVLKTDPDRPGWRGYANPEPVNWTVIILYDMATSEPVAFLHESHVSGFRVGATSAAAIAAMARPDCTELGLFGTGRQGRSHFEAITRVRPIKRVRVFSPNPENRKRFVADMARDGIDIVAMDDPRDVVAGADILCAATTSKDPVFDGKYLEKGQMVVSIANTDLNLERHEVADEVLIQSEAIVVTDWESVGSNRQIELLGLIEKGLVTRDRVHELGDVLSGRTPVKSTRDNIVYFKNNTGLGMQFAAAGAVIYNKLKDEGTNRVVPREWLASEKYSQS
jgi:alanine dehydrogenase